MWGFGVVAVIGLVLFGLLTLVIVRTLGDRPLPEGRRRFRGSTLGLVETIYHPATEHVVEERASREGRRTQHRSGDDPEAPS